MTDTKCTHEPATIFVTLPTGSDGRDTVSINISEVASYRGHTVVSYSYEDWTEIVLKNGVRHDCRVSHSEFEKRMADMALAAMEGDQ